MQHATKIKWGTVSRVLSGNLEIEHLMVTEILPQGNYWLVVANLRGDWFAGSRKAKLRDSGKGQIAFGGLVGLSCELIRGKTSSGAAIQFLEVIERPGKPFAMHYLDAPPPDTWFE